MSEFHYRVPDTFDGIQIEWGLELKMYGYHSERITCTVCHGARKGPAMFGISDDEYNCMGCGGMGTILNPKYKGQPNPPQWLIDKLSRVMKEAWNQAENERFRLTP